MEMRAVNEDANQSLVAGENSNSYGATDKGPVYKVCCDVNHQSPVFTKCSSYYSRN